MTVLAALLAGAAAMLLRRPRAHGDRATPSEPNGPPADRGWRRHRVPVTLATALTGPAWLGGLPGLVMGVLLAATVWAAIGRFEGAGERAAREQAARDLPTLVELLGLALAGGAPVAGALREVADAVPGGTADELRMTAARLEIGTLPAAAWAELGRRPGLDRLARALARAEQSGAPVARIVARLADDLAAERRSRVEDLARSVGVRAALPLGLFLLPAFLLLGIVPVVVTTLSGLPW